MRKTAAYAALSAKRALVPFVIDRRIPGAHDVAIEVAFCGICHSDVHQARDEWGGSQFPMVPGHEIVGRVSKSPSRKFKAGELVGVGCMVNSCRNCENCKRGLEQFCDKGCAWTYNSTEMDRETPTYGGYSTHIVVHEDFVLRVPAGLDPAG
ncbi:MAG TPA: alcohol dehydrogenase catalytic domain-containing protein, partial [Myxococcales bacterium]|nr:alcohol dehydrogenase catalytic domain-containing protein [Myxococcales bacterium]